MKAPRVTRQQAILNGQRLRERNEVERREMTRKALLGSDYAPMREAEVELKWRKGMKGLTEKMREERAKAAEHKIYPYRCGYDPRNHTLKDVVTHWRSCPHERCRQMAASWEPLKRDLIQQFKGGKIGVPSDVPLAGG